MKTLAITLFAVIASLSLGCSSLVVVDDDGGTATTGHALTAEQCKDQCKDEFHQCRNSPDRGGGPGASACAHQKNDCESRC